ncbi:MAG: sigma-70 family RNA polymerase sigma factor [Planctomycetes bacterium]|nr:sigma-70 family RNA polymerase sigma factor [Planctomycetota bacterium]
MGFLAEATRDLVFKAQGGDREAFSRLAERYQQKLECLVHLRLGSRLRQQSDVEDVTQECFLKAFLSIGQFVWQGEGSFFHWLGKIAENVINDLARKQLKARKRGGVEPAIGAEGSPAGKDPSQPLDGLVSPEVSPSRALRRQERLDRLEKVLDQLSPERREVVVLALVHELPSKEIAARMGRSPEAVSMLLLRSLRQLKDLFGHTDSFHLPAASFGEAEAGEDRHDSEKPR